MPIEIQPYLPLLITAVALLIVITYVAWLGWKIWREGELDAADFARRFPGRCMICSYHQHGVDHGFVNAGEQPPPHHCIEARRG